MSPSIRLRSKLIVVAEPGELTRPSHNWRIGDAVSQLAVRVNPHLAATDIHYSPGRDPLPGCQLRVGEVFNWPSWSSASIAGRLIALAESEAEEKSLTEVLLARPSTHLASYAACG